MQKWKKISINTDLNQLINFNYFSKKDIKCVFIFCKCECFLEKIPHVSKEKQTGRIIIKKKKNLSLK